MSKIDDKIDDIKTQKIGVSRKRVLIVEGDDDVGTLSTFLTRKFPGWETSWLIEPAGNKKQALQILSKESRWLGLVDRDEWSNAEVIYNTQTTPNMMVLPRFCMESYLVAPSDLWAALPATQQAKITGGQAQLAQEIEACKPNWLRHAALWHVINPLWGQLRSAGFKDAVLDPQSVPDDTDLQSRLNQWQATVDPQTIMQAVHQVIADLHGKTDEEYYSQWLYAKAFYPQVVLGILNRLLAITMDTKTWRSRLVSHLPVPSDLDPVWARMGL